MMSKKILIALFVCLIYKLNAATATITTAKDTVCTMQTVKFKVSSTGAVLKYEWAITDITGTTLFPNDTTSTFTNQFTIAGTYTVTAYSMLSPSGIDSAKKVITVMQSATSIFGISAITPTVGIPQTVSFADASLNSLGCIWDFGDASGQVVQTNPQHTYSVSSTYTVTLVSIGIYACNDTSKLTVTIIDTTGLTMPNVFTPNGDGINDYFAPNAHNMQTLTCLIYDRWGSKMATLDNINQQYWDGRTSSGLACSAGTYFYIVTGTDANGKSYNLKGFFELIK